MSHEGVPFRCQFASPHLVNKFLTDPDLTASDPQWARTGWSTASQYAYWAWRTCGVACLRSVIAALGVTEPTCADLTKELVTAGAYAPAGGGPRRGLVYAPFVSHLANRWSLAADTVLGVRAGDLQALLSTPGQVLIASVAPHIRDLPTHSFSDMDRTDDPDRGGPHADPAFPFGSGDDRGGHLVLATAYEPDGYIRFHNPSGYWPDRQQDNVMALDVFASTFAGRGITITLPHSSPP